MLHVRIISPPQLVGSVLEVLDRHPAITNVIRIPGAGYRPPGDVLLCDVAREDASLVLSELRGLELVERGSVAVSTIDVSLSTAADRAEEAAVGSPGDAVLWEELESKTASSADLTFGFLLMMALATALGAAGILEDSVVLIIGAMVVGTEFGPLAGVCVAVVQRRGDLAARSLQALLVGLPIAIAVALVMVLALDAAGLTPATLERTRTGFISHPNEYSILVALLAGLAGMISLTTAKSGALIGVLISVNTVPAAANIAVAGAYRDWTDLAGAASQLGLNIACIVIAGIAALSLQRLAFSRRVAQGLAERVNRRRRRIRVPRRPGE